MSSDRLARTAMWLFAASALAFLLLLHRAPYPGHVVLKALPILCLLVVVLRARGQSFIFIALALVFCGAGDIALALGHFLPGLGAFLVGHLFYLAAFSRDLQWSLRNLVSLGVLGLCVVALVLYLSPHLGDMRMAVYAYMLVIIAMTSAAILGRYNHILVAAGAMLFMISDSLIAVNRFALPFPGAAYAIMVTYYAAQYLLTRDARE